MKKSSIFVGLDVHKNSIEIAIAEAGEGSGSWRKNGRTSANWWRLCRGRTEAKMVI